DLKPDTSALVVLPLPLRSRDIVYRKFDMDPRRRLDEGENACFEYLAPAAALELFACEFAANDGGRAEDVWYYCFAKKDDRRLGFLTLLRSAGYDPQRHRIFKEIREQQVNESRVTPLVRYLSLGFDDDAIFWQQRLGIFPGPKPANEFLSNLLVFRALAVR